MGPAVVLPDRAGRLKEVKIMNTSDLLTVDHAHVLLDALNVSERRIKEEGWAPWLDYYAGPNGGDTKANRAGYLALLAGARRELLHKVIREAREAREARS